VQNGLDLDRGRGLICHVTALDQWVCGDRINLIWLLLYLCPRQGCRVLQSVCLYVCLCVYLRAYLKQVQRLNFTKRSVHCYLLPWLGPPLTAMQCGWRHVVANWSKWARIKDEAYVLLSSPGGNTESEVCRLRLHLVIATQFLSRW